MLVLACGNPLREDDGAAWRVAAALCGSGFDMRCLQQLGPELAEDVSRAEEVLFLDAREGGEPGAVRIEALSRAAEGPGLSHALSPGALLLCAERLYGRAPRAALLTLTGERFGHGEGLSPTVQAALPEAIRLARLSSIAGEPGGSGDRAAADRGGTAPGGREGARAGPAACRKASRPS